MNGTLFGDELRLRREQAGYTTQQLGDAVGYSAAQIQHVETGRRQPKPDLAERADKVLDLDGLLVRIQKDHARRAATPDWLRPWSDIEDEAAALWWFELSLMPGLLQTETYARALMDDEGKVAARLERQRILNREDPPELAFLIAERALRYPLGGAEVMREQLEHLLTISERHVVQIVPEACGTHLHLDGSFGLAVADGREYCYTDTPAKGYVEDDPEIVLAMRWRLDLIRAEALPREESRRLIREVANQ